MLLCDADGCLFPSEEPAFAASAEVTNSFLAQMGSVSRYTGPQLRLATTGKNFRTTVRDLAQAEGIALDPAELELWVEMEKKEVTSRLRQALRPDPAVTGPLGELARSRRLAVVTSSAGSRLDACLTATGLSDLFPPDTRFSAEDSLPRPAGKPDPAIYRFAGDRMAAPPGAALAVEDSVPGVQSAVAAGYETVGLLLFVPAEEREERRLALVAAGAAGVLSSWKELEVYLAEPAEEPAVTAS